MLIVGLVGGLLAGVVADRGYPAEPEPRPDEPEPRPERGDQSP